MTELVPTEEIEKIVGVVRHRNIHYGRAVSVEQTVYILHSKECLESGIDLRQCRFSMALDRGIQVQTWRGYEDVVVALGIWGGNLIPRHSAVSDTPMTSPSEDQWALTWSGKWHIVAAPHNAKYHIAVCGAYVERDYSPRYPEHLKRIQDGTRKSTGTCKTCLRIAGIRTVTVELPKPTEIKAATDDENGYHSWEYPGGEVIVYDDGTIEHGGRHYGSPSLLRKPAAAMLAAAELSENLIGRAE